MSHSSTQCSVSTLHRRQPYKVAPVQVCDPDHNIIAMPLVKWRIKLLAAVCTAVALLLVVSLFYSIPTEETEYSTSGSTVYKDGVICPKVGYTLALSYQDQMTSAVIRMAALQCWAHPYKLYVVEPVVDNSHLVCPFSNNLSTDMTYLSDIIIQP